MRPTLIGVTGPSCSGKTTICKKVVQALHYANRLDGDEFWKDKSTFPRIDGMRVWDLPGNLNYNLLFKNLSEIKEGKPTFIPKCERYQFKEMVQRDSPNTNAKRSTITSNFIILSPFCPNPLLFSSLTGKNP